MLKSETQKGILLIDFDFTY